MDRLFLDAMEEAKRNLHASEQLRRLDTLQREITIFPEAPEGLCAGSSCLQGIKGYCWAPWLQEQAIRRKYE